MEKIHTEALEARALVSLDIGKLELNFNRHIKLVHLGCYFQV